MKIKRAALKAGKRYSEWETTGNWRKNKWGSRELEVKCSCEYATVKYVTVSSLNAGTSKSCFKCCHKHKKCGPSEERYAALIANNTSKNNKNGYRGIRYISRLGRYRCYLISWTELDIEYFEV